MPSTITTAPDISASHVKIPMGQLGAAVAWWSVVLHPDTNLDDSVADKKAKSITFLQVDSPDFVPEAIYLRWSGLTSLLAAFDRHCAAGHRHTLAVRDFSGLLVAFEDPCGNSVWHRTDLPNSHLKPPVQAELLFQCFIGMPVDMDAIARASRQGRSLEAFLNCDSLTIADVQNQSTLARSMSL